MTRYLTEADVQKLLTMPMALQWMEEARRALAEQRAIDVPRRNCRSAADPSGLYSVTRH